MIGHEISRARGLLEIENIIAKYGRDKVIKWRGRKGGNLLHQLAHNNAPIRAARRAIAIGVDINLARRHDGNTPLHLATYPARYAEGVVQALMEVGARRDLENKYGEIPVVKGEKSMYERAILPDDVSDDLLKRKSPEVTVNHGILKCLVQQCYPTSCGIASLAMTACHLFKKEFGQEEMCSLYAKQCISEHKGRGVSFGEYPEIVRQFTQDQRLPLKFQQYPGESDVDNFAKELTAQLEKHFPPAGRPINNSMIVVNYWRIVDGKITGHWSPIAGVWWQKLLDTEDDNALKPGTAPAPTPASTSEYDHERTYVLIADTQGNKLPPHWIPLKLLAERVSSYVRRSDSYRGYVVLSKKPVARSRKAKAAALAAAAMDSSSSDQTGSGRGRGRLADMREMSIGELRTLCNSLGRSCRYPAGNYMKRTDLLAEIRRK